MVALKGEPDIGDQINKKIIAPLASANKLSDFPEYLMRHFATESGKSKGQFYTPAEVSRIMAKIAALDAAVHGEMDRVSQQLTRRFKDLAERYETSLPQMVSRVTELEAKVNRHLERMGELALERPISSNRA